MCMCVYVCVFVCMCVYVCVYVPVCMCVCTHCVCASPSAVGCVTVCGHGGLMTYEDADGVDDDHENGEGHEAPPLVVVADP